MHKIPVFIVGINPRSGTNYLHQLIALHPDCIVTKHHGEDFILYASDKYLEFYDIVTKHWSDDWKNDNQSFKKSLESGLLNYLDPGTGTAKYMVTKTPSAINSNNYLDMFSEGYMIVITRKGQDLVESFMKTFNSRFEDAVRGWKRGAEAIHKVMNDPKLMNSERVIVIKYEDLYQNNTEVMTRILDFLKLDKSKFDFDKSANFDVIGSSTFKGDSKKVTWDPIPKTKTFNPLGRFSHWSRFRHYRFNWMAGKYSKELGYELYFDSKDPLYYIYNTFLTPYDFIHRTVRRMLIIVRSLKKGKGARRDAFDIKLN